MSRKFKLHLTTRCGCTKVIDHGSTTPPRDYVVVLEKSREQRYPAVVALSLAALDPRVHEAIRDEEQRDRRRFAMTGYSGTEDFGTAFYVEV